MASMWIDRSLENVGRSLEMIDHWEEVQEYGDDDPDVLNGKGDVRVSVN